MPNIVTDPKMTHAYLWVMSQHDPAVDRYGDELTKLNVSAVVGKKNGDICVCNAISILGTTQQHMNRTHSKHKPVEKNGTDVKWLPPFAEVEVR